MSADEAAADDGGCGCRAVGHSAPVNGSWATLGLLGLALLRRRRR
jgi:MYXO-CTERM domain-containing protein